MATPLRWTTDDFPWLRADLDGQPIFLRLNVAFPDEAAYSLLVNEDVTVELDDLPVCWERGPLDWPDRADKCCYPRHRRYVPIPML